VYIGRLTKEQIKAGYSALQVIASCVDKADFGAKLTAACNDFYTRIPHYFGFASPLDTTTKCHCTQFGLTCQCLCHCQCSTILLLNA